MSHKNKVNLSMQSKAILEKMICFGLSKNAIKRQAEKEWEQSDKSISLFEYINSALRDKIFSIKTYGEYVKQINEFIGWVEANHPYRERKTISQIRQYVPEWIEFRKKEHLSAWTIKKDVAALAKLYQCQSKDFGVETPSKTRANITRSRGHAVRDDDFSISKNAEIINFCRGTGLRRSELKSLTGKQLISKQNGTFCLAIVGKGGRYREAPIVGPHIEDIVARIRNAGDGLVWSRVPSHMDVHSYRSDYATAIYTAYARPIDSIPKSKVYVCRGSRKGERFDRDAMLIASKALGHNRLNVIASHYLR